MDKNEMNEALNELSAEMQDIGQRIGTLRDVHDLKIQSARLFAAQQEFDIYLRMMERQ